MVDVAVQVGNFRVEPPGLFRGRGEHPKMGKLKKRVYPYDITINIGKGEPIPEHPFPGMKWKEIRHDNTVTWLAYWKVIMSTLCAPTIYVYAACAVVLSSEPHCLAAMVLVAGTSVRSCF